MSQMWNGVGENNFGNSLVAKRTTLRASMGRPLRLWVGFGDRVTIFAQHCCYEDKFVHAYILFPL